MTSESALEAFARFQERQQANADALFENIDPVVDDFISFVWMFLAVGEDLGVDPVSSSITSIVDSTLAARQSSQARRRLLSLASSVRTRYINTNPNVRLRWGRTGTSIGTASSLDGMAKDIAERLIERSLTGGLGDLEEPRYVAQILAPFVNRLQELREAPRWRFRKSAQGDAIDVRASDLLVDWLGGASLQQLADQALAVVPDPAWRIEQMVDTVAAHFEHYLSWTLGALVELTNLHLAEKGEEIRICPDFSSYVRYGVGEPAALILMRAGVRSRRLANAIAFEIPSDAEPSSDSIRQWLGEQSVAEWRARLGATASELVDLLDFTRVRRRSLLKDLLEQGRVAVELPGVVVQTSRPLQLEAKREEETPAPLCLYSDSEEVAMVSPRDQADLEAILATGLDIDLSIEMIDSTARLVITAA